MYNRLHFYKQCAIWLPHAELGLWRLTDDHKLIFFEKQTFFEQVNPLRLQYIYLKKLFILNLELVENRTVVYVCLFAESLIDYLIGLVQLNLLSLSLERMDHSKSYLQRNRISLAYTRGHGVGSFLMYQNARKLSQPIFSQFFLKICRCSSEITGNSGDAAVSLLRTADAPLS